ncbi:MAG TPA: penicillin-binding protein 2 [Terriglobia bacterium]|nr:penicillin-binding protein 2 [Terriglobia bacterium]
MQVRFPEDERFPAWKITFLEYLIAAVFIALLVGYWRLQIGQHTQLLEQAEHNRIRDLPIIAPRGRILDRDGHVLVDNFPSFTILLNRDNLAHLSDAHLERLAKALDLDPGDVTNLIAHSAKLPRFQPIVLKQAASLQDVAFLDAHESEFPEIDIIQSQQRFYPKHGVAAQVLGYVGEVSQADLAKPGSHYRPGDLIGKFGIEKEYNSILRGRDGMKRVIVNSRGQEAGALGTINALPGHDLRLTLDLNLQMTAEAALGDEPGAVVALDPRTGSVLAMASHPTFDPNDFTHHIPLKIWKQLTTDPQHPLMNKAIQAQLAPGSIFKIITGTAALETATIKPDFTVHCSGEVTIYGHTFHDWTWWTHRGGHGAVDFHRAIVISCDVYFYTLGKMLGIQKIDYFADHLGLGHRTGIDLPDEDSGLIPSPAWVRKAFHRQWWPGETMSVAIGQGAVQVTPLQVAYVIGGIASGGDFARPHLAFPQELENLGTDPPAHSMIRFPLHDSTVQAVTNGMWGVVNEPGGTGARARCAGLNVAGKTGTAQVVSSRLQDSAHKAAYRDNAWFVGYSPSPNPDIVVAVLVMQGGHSSVAAPIAGQVIKAYYQEKEKSNPPAQQVSEISNKAQPGAGAPGP